MVAAVIRPWRSDPRDRFLLIHDWILVMHDGADAVRLWRSEPRDRFPINHDGADPVRL